MTAGPVFTPDPVILAKVHAECFVSPRPWNAAEFGGFLFDPTVIFTGSHDAFALGRIVLDEAELLTIAVAKDARRLGLGRLRLLEFERTATRRGSVSCFLEVAADNQPALALYESTGYRESGRRNGYYSRSGAQNVDAILMSRALTQG
jgi:ribosomal-protein-alanine N-acetyltransferase